MKIGIVSDIHSNAPGLKQALYEMGPVDLLLCAGDVISQFRLSDEVAEVLQEAGAVAVKGNHDSILFSPQGERLRSSRSIRPENLRYLEGLPTSLTMTIEGKRIFMAHTSRLDTTAYDIPYPFSGQKDHLPEMDTDILIVGHTHIPTVHREGSLLIVNPGTCGDPRDPLTPGRLSYAILDTATWQTAIREFQLDEAVGDEPAPKHL